MKILKVITLQNKKIKLDLLPEIGGRISSLIFDDFHVFHFSLFELSRFNFHPR